MTLLPTEEQRIGKGRKGGVSVRLPPICMKAGCFEQQNIETHHVVRRSHLGGAYDAVEIDDVLMPNVVALCHRHHLMLTDNKARLVYEHGAWHWQQGDGVENALEPAPVLIYAEPAPVPVMAPESLGERMIKAQRPKFEHDSKTCPRCKGKGKIPKEEKRLNAPKRKYKTWSMGIPVDAGENGYEIWRTNLEACSERIQDILGYSDTVPPYYVLIAVTADWLNTTDREGGG